VIWGGDWDPLLAKDRDGVLVRRMEETVDGEWQKYSVESGAYNRKVFFSKDPRLLELVKHLSDEQIRKLRLGGHDPGKIYAAYKAAASHKDAPSVILARTIKGYGLGEAGEGRNITHQQKKLNEEELREFRSRFGIPVSDEEIADAPFHRLPEHSPEMEYLMRRRKELGGPVPKRIVKCRPLSAPGEDLFQEFMEGTGDREMATTMVLVRMLSKLMRDSNIGKLIVPIVRTRPALSGWNLSSARWGSTRMSASCTSLSTRKPCSITRKPRTGRSWRKGSRRQAPFPRLSRPERRMLPSAST